MQTRLLAVFAEAASGQARLVLVTGEAGIGKTTLVGEAVHRTGLPVGWGTGADADRVPALWPWTCATRSLLSNFDPAQAAALTAIDTDQLARLLPELAGDQGESTDLDLAPDAADTEAPQTRLATELGPTPGGGTPQTADPRPRTDTDAI